MTEEEHTISDLRIGNAKLEQRVNFLEKVVYGIASGTAFKYGRFILYVGKYIF